MAKIFMEKLNMLFYNTPNKLLQAIIIIGFRFFFFFFFGMGRDKHSIKHILMIFRGKTCVWQ